MAPSRQLLLERTWKVSAIKIYLCSNALIVMWTKKKTPANSCKSSWINGWHWHTFLLRHSHCWQGRSFTKPHINQGALRQLLFVLSTCWNALAFGKLAAPAYLLKYFCIPVMIVQNWLLCSRTLRGKKIKGTWNASNTSSERFFPDTEQKQHFFFYYLETFYDDMSKHREVVILASIWLLLINNYPIVPSEPIFGNAVRLPGGPSLPFHLGQILLRLAKINRAMMINTRQVVSLSHTPSHTFRHTDEALTQC